MISLIIRLYNTWTSWPLVCKQYIFRLEGIIWTTIRLMTKNQVQLCYHWIDANVWLGKATSCPSHVYEEIRNLNRKQSWIDNKRLDVVSLCVRDNSFRINVTKKISRKRKLIRYNTFLCTMVDCTADWSFCWGYCLTK